jgi:transcriptional regulator with XRE-family HTH domain
MDGRELYARRLALGLSQPALAAVLDTTQATVSRWEAGTRRIPPGIEDELHQVEQRVGAAADALVAAAPAVIALPDTADGPTAVAAARALVALRETGVTTHITPGPDTAPGGSGVG